jgi:predicted dehydrogenase
VGDRLRSGIIGTGFAGAVHARALRAAGDVVAVVASSSADGARAAAHALQAERHELSADDLISADDIDVVHVCTPNSSHLHLALAALAAGKHVICEKPLAMDLEGAHELAAAAAESALITAIPFVYRFYPMVRDARQRVRRGDTGRLRRCTCSLSRVAAMWILAQCWPCGLSSQAGLS